MSDALGPFLPDGTPVDGTPLDELAEGYREGEPRTVAEYDEVVIAGVSVPASTVQGTDLSRFEPKQTVGPYDKDTDETQSSWIQDTFVGGQLINTHVGGATDNRFRSAVGWTLNSEQFTAGPKIERSEPYGILYDAGNIGTPPYPNVFNASCPLGEFNGAFWYTIGSQLFKLTSVPNRLDDVDILPLASLTFPPVDVGTIYGPPMADHSLPTRRPRMWIPLGIEGHQAIRDDDSISAVDTTIKAIAFKAWDRSLWALTTDGYLRRYTQWDGNTTGDWDAATSDMKIDRDQRPMSLEVFWGPGGGQSLFIATDKQMWVYDPDTQRVIPTELAVPRHPDNGWGFAEWRSDAIYYNQGIDLARYSRDGVRTEVGMGQDGGIDITTLLDPYPTTAVTGLPFTSQYAHENSTGKAETPPTVPFIGYLTGSLNYLIAGMGRGVTVNGDGTYTSRLSVDVWNEAGWHTIARFETTTTGCWVTPGPMVMSETVGGYRLWMGMMAWGTDMTNLVGPETATGTLLDDYDGDLRMVSIQIPRHFHGPLQMVTKNVGHFEEYGELKTGWFTAGMLGFDKLNSHLDVQIDQPEGIDQIEGHIDVEYRLKEHPQEWVYLGTADQFGSNLMPFAVDEDNFPEGVDSQGIEYWFKVYVPNEMNPPVMSAFVHKFIKIPLPGRAFLMSVPLSDENWQGTGPQQIDDFLAQQTYGRKFVKLIHNDRTYRIRVAQHQMVEGTGAVRFKNTTINAVEVPIPGWPRPDDSSQEWIAAEQAEETGEEWIEDGLPYAEDPFDG